MNQYTSAEANAMLRALREEEQTILRMEQNQAYFNAAVGEDPEAVRPAYHFVETCQRLRAVEEKMLTIKHAINRFNLSTEVPETGLTVDAVLVRMPQLTARKAVLSAMAEAPDRARVQEFGAAFIDYRFTNFDRQEVTAELAAVSAELGRLQRNLDLLNSTDRSISLPF